jgi:hypothetical protein
MINISSKSLGEMIEEIRSRSGFHVPPLEATNKLYIKY